MESGKSERQATFQSAAAGVVWQAGGHENLPSAGLGAPTVLQACSRQSKAVPAFPSTFCTGAVLPALKRIPPNDTNQHDG